MCVLRLSVGKSKLGMEVHVKYLHRSSDFLDYLEVWLKYSKLNRQPIVSTAVDFVG